jgi:hypothetical protein
MPSAVVPGREFNFAAEIFHHVEGAGQGFAARRAAAAVTSLNRWRGMLRSAKRRRSSGIVSKSASMKISTVFIAGINLDTNGRIAEIDLVSSSVLSSNDGVRHCRTRLRGAAATSGHRRPVSPQADILVIITWNERAAESRVAVTSGQRLHEGTT